MADHAGSSHQLIAQEYTMFMRSLAPLRRWARLALALLFVGSAPLWAQLDPKLKTIDTDFLDLFQASGSTGVKPEILTVLDFSGSMAAVMWHPDYYTSAGQADHLPSGWTGTGDAAGRVYVSSMPASGGPIVLIGVWNVLNKSALTSFTFASGTASGTNLIMADGNPVTATDVSNQSGPFKTLTTASNWVRLATHVRIKGTYGALVRTLDLPIPYTTLDSPTSVARTAAANPPWPIGITATGVPSSSFTSSHMIDPVTAYDTYFDTAINVTSNADPLGYLNNSPGGLGWVGTFWYNHDYLYWLFFGKDKANSPTKPNGTTMTANYIIPDVITSAKTAFMNGIPSMARYQGVKRACIKTWLANQTKVYWCYRYLDSAENSKSTVDPGNGSQSAATNTRDMRIFGKGGANSADAGVDKMTKAIPTGGTPLTYALANSLAQLNVYINSQFDTPHTADKYTSPQCQTMFVVLFTDGIANDSFIGGGHPYPDHPPATNCNASVGNAAVNTAHVTSLDATTGANFNTWTLAAVAAHGADPALPDKIPLSASYPTNTAQKLSLFSPFFIKSRGHGGSFETVFTTPRPIQTMTVGVSLEGSYSQIGSAKYALLATACAGDPQQTSWEINNAEPYSATNPNTYFFDARDPDSLANNISAVIQAILDIANKQATSSPSIPFAGVGLADQVYLGQFKPSTTGGPVWTGDLMMFPTQIDTKTLSTLLLDANGNQTPYLDCSTAMWSVARDVFNVASATSTGGSAGKGCTNTSSTPSSTTGCGPVALATPINWSARKILTRLPATVGTPNPDVTPFTDADPSFTAIKGSLPGADDTAKKDLINFMRGAELTSSATPKANRNDIMGDIVDSVPAVLEYDWSGVTFKNNLPTNVKTALDAHPNGRLRVVFVGTNQGFMHAFAEASWIEVKTVNSVKVNVNTGTVGELWAFLPTDFLGYLDWLRGNNNKHKYMVNGSPYVYHLDLAADSSKVTGDGKVQPTELAYLVFGLRKGGRSYYSLDIHDPTDPHISWTLRADETATFPAGKVSSAVALATAKTLVGNMGYSTSAMLPGRVLFQNKIKDILLLGGGLSTPLVEANYSNTALGRSVIGVDILTGQILQAWDLLSLSGLASTVVGPVSAGVVPTRVLLNSDLHQRGYFTDYFGNVWAIGDGQTNTADPLKDFRTDTSEMDKWITNSLGLSLRRIYKDDSTNGVNRAITTLPAPYVVGDFPVNSSSPTNTVHPRAIGIAFVTGNRYNPLDFNYTSTTVPSQHRFNMIFDRSDSKVTGMDTTPITTAKMTDFSASTDPAALALNPSNAAYYLKTNYGWYVKFPATTTVTNGNSSTYFVPKGITEPTVLGYSAFYSIFTPTSSDPCSGGTGNTTTYSICNSINPIVDSSSVTGATCISGLRMTWAGVASNFSAIGTVAAIQAGMITPSTPPPSGDSTILGLKTMPGNNSERFPRVRVWRTVR